MNHAVDFTVIGVALAQPTSSTDGHSGLEQKSWFHRHHILDLFGVSSELGVDVVAVAEMGPCVGDVW